MAASPTLGGFHKPKKFARLKFLQSAEIPTFTYGTFEDVPPGDVEKALRSPGKKGATVEVSDQRAYCGRYAAHITVEKGGLGAITLNAKVKAGTGYRALFAHCNKIVSFKPGVPAMAPRTRVIFRDDTGKSVTPTKDYSWSGVPLDEKSNVWRISPHVFTTPPKATRISLTFFFPHPGEYWLDEVRLEELAAARR